MGAGGTQIITGAVVINAVLGIDIILAHTQRTFITEKPTFIPRQRPCDRSRESVHELVLVELSAVCWQAVCAGLLHRPRAC